MREIKFRAWLKETKNMIQVYDISWNKEMINTERAWRYFDEIAFDEIELMQYTGLKDKNGKEIYDGDIVKCVSELYSEFGKYSTGKFNTTYYEICSINKNAYCFGKRRVGEKYILEGILRSCAKEYYEVIGNIYENPELLEEVE